MTRAFRKKKSHRQTLRQKYMIQKKVKAYTKKKNREARRRKKLGIFKRKKKEIKIPNSWVGKEKLILEEISLRKMEIEEEEQRVTLKKLRRQANKARREAMLLGAGTDSKNFKEPVTQTDIRDANKVDRKQHYRRELNKLIEACDVVVEVLDARDPLGCRCKLMETRVASMKAAKVDSSKKLVFLLNKIDLIPPEVLSKWVRYLRREYPVIAFKASTQAQKKNLGRKNTYLKTMTDNPDTYKNTAKCLGADALIELVQNYSRSVDLKTPITVGFVGYPNVGKSSIVNSLKRHRAVGTSSTPGFTQNLQEVKLYKNIILVDSPGVILNENDDDASLVLKNSVKLQDIDAVDTVNKIVSRINPIQMMEFYGIPAFNNGDEFLIEIAKSRGRMKPGGIPDLQVAARMVLQDWNRGKIKYYLPPPELPSDAEESEAKFVQDWGKELDVNSILNVNMERASLQIETTVNTKHYIALKPSPAGKMDVED